MKYLEALIEHIVLGSRWLLVVFYGGLGLALLAYAVSFVFKLIKAAQIAPTATEESMVLAMLGLIDAALVASLIVMVMISGYENFVSRFNTGKGGLTLSWMGKLDAGGLKVKVAVAIVAISSIHLLQVFFNVEHYGNDKILWATAIHMALIISALLLAVLDRVSHAPHGDTHHVDGP